MNVPSLFYILLASLLLSGCTLDAVLFPAQVSPSSEALIEQEKGIFPIVNKDVFGFLGPIGGYITSDGHLTTIGYSQSKLVQKWNVQTGALISEWGEVGTNDGDIHSGSARYNIDSSGKYYVVSDTGGPLIKVYDSSGQFLWKNDGSAVVGGFAQSSDVAVDKNGLVYIANQQAGQAVVLNPDGSFNRTIGTQGFNPGEQTRVDSVAVDDSLNVYCLDRFDNEVLKYNSAGILLGKLDYSPLPGGDINDARIVRVNSDGEIFVSNPTQVFKFDASGTYVSVSDGNPTANFASINAMYIGSNDKVYVTDGLKIVELNKNNTYAQTYARTFTDEKFGIPLSVWIDDSDSIFVASSPSSSGLMGITKFNSLGEKTTLFGSDPAILNSAFGVVGDSQGYIYVTDFQGNKLSKFDKDGNHIASYGSTGAGQGQFQTPAGIALGKDGFLYIADFQNNRVQKFSTAGAFVEEIGNSGAGQLVMPTAVAFDTAGNLYVASAGDGSIKKYDSDGNFVISFAGMPMTYGIYVDAENYIYVTALTTHQVKKYDSSGNLVLSWGGLGVGLGKFSMPSGIFGDSKGNIFVAEYSNPRVQKFSNMGVQILE